MRFILRIAGCLLLSLFGCDNGGSVDLKPPPEGQGFHFETEDFKVPAGVEEQDCYFFQVPDDLGDVVYVSKVEAVMNEGSHHMNVFRVKTIHGLDPANGEIQRSQDGVGECYTSSNWADWPIVLNTQDDSREIFAWELPSGVAHKFVPGEWLMLQTHYVNATTQKTPETGHVEVNFWTTDESNVESELGTLFATKQTIRVCEHNPTPTFSGSCQFNGTGPVHVIGANAHFHSRGTKFDIYEWDGVSNTTPPSADRFYRSTEWDHPPMNHSPDIDRTIPAGGGVYYTCSYEWQEPPAAVGCDRLNELDAAKGTDPADFDCCYTFGGVVESQEHCNIFVYYYPKVDDIACF